MKKRKISLAIPFAIVSILLVQATILEDKTQSEFNKGTYQNTFFNTSTNTIQLNISENLLTGNYTSQIFSTGSSQFNNISWTQGAPYKQPLPNNKDVETILGGANMTGNVLLMHLNENSGAIFDNSGSGNNGTNFGAIYSVEGKLGTSLDFDGDNDYINIPANPSLSFRDEITLEAWINWRGEASASNNEQNIITNGQWNRALLVTEPDHWNGGNQILTLIKIGSGGSSNHELFSNSRIAKNKWYHVSMVYNTTDLSIYINGKLDASEAASGQIVATSINTFIGVEETSRFFNGSIDEVAIYNRALTKQELLDHYKRGALQLNLSIRSCNDPNCSGETFTELNNTSPQTFSIENNSYIQYNFEFKTLNESVTPELYNVTIDYTTLNVAPTISISYPTQNKFLNNNQSIQLNFSATDNDANIDSCWYNLDNTDNITILNCQNTTFNTTEGFHTLNIFANDTENLKSNSSTNFTIDITNPSISITHPQPIFYNSNQTQLNFTALDTNIDSCWYTLNSGTTNTTINCGQNVTGISSNEGQNTWTIYTNDSAGNTNLSFISFTIDTILPEITISRPESKIYSTNTSLPLNFSISDANLNSCWYTLDSGTTNISLPNCQNTTFNTTSDRLYTLNLFANDTLNNINNATVTFTILTIAPAINIIYPKNSSYINYNNNIYLNYSVSSGISISSCQLWGDFSGTWALNQTNSIITLEDNFFTLNLTENTYNWGIICNDTQNQVSNINSTFIVDTTTPTLSLTEPTGTKTSRNSIPITFSTSDTNLNSCWYNIKHGATTDVSNTTTLCNSTTETFNLTLDADFTLNFYVNDSAGNTNYSSITFTVDTSTSPSTPSGGSGGGGSGGGGGFLPPTTSNKTRVLKIEFGKTEIQAMRRGTSSSLSLGVTSLERTFLNDCKIKIEGPLYQFITSDKTTGLSPGEKSIFNLEINVPQTAEPGEYPSDITIKCEEGTANTNIKLTIFRNTFEAKFKDYEKANNKLKIFYNLEEFSNENHEIQLQYKITDFENYTLTEGQTEIILEGSQNQEYILEIELPKNAFGEFDLSMTLSDNEVTNHIDEKIILTSKGLTGLAISDENKRTLSNLGVILLIVSAISYVSYFIYKKIRIRKTIKELRKKHDKHTIKLDLKHK